MRGFRTAGVLVVAIAASASPASGATERQSLRIDDAVPRTCDAALLPARAPGVASRTWSASAAGFFEARLVGNPFGGDWDLAVFRLPAGKEIAASTSVGAAELATAWIRRGDRLAIQVCRRDGRERSVPLEIEFRRGSRPQPTGQRISLASVRLYDPGDVQRLEAMGFDVTEDVTPTRASVVLYDDAERARLRAAGFASRTTVADLTAAGRADRAVDARAAATPGRSALPSGRDTYRVYADYTNRMQALVAGNPNLVRPVVLGTTIEGRTIEGIEMATDVNRTDDGRPVYLNMGEHHAREWPSAELPMEFAIDLVQNQADPRIAALLANVRTIIVPVVNVDGFIASREGTSAGEFKRKNCRPNIPGEAALPCEQRNNSGVDLNRNYGAYWGGVGASPTVSSDIYRGTAPFSEPESEAVHQFTANLQPTVFITNHTFTGSGYWLRQPGFTTVISVTPDEAAMKDLGDDMAAATGWISDFGYAIGAITGATEDWNYFAQGTYGYTPEVRGNGFHDPYADMVVEEYLGDATHVGLGVREAFLIAGGRAANPADHGIIQGTVPAGSTLRLHKEFDTPTSVANPPFVSDVLDTTLTAPASGQYTWHVNPSARPLVPGETWTMSCELPSQTPEVAQVPVARGQGVHVDWDSACQTSFTNPRTLTLNKTGSGTGTVTSNPAAIDCGATCSGLFSDSTSVVLTAAASGGSNFTGWTNCDSLNVNQCTVTMDADTTVTAGFNLISAGGGSGTVPPAGSGSCKSKVATLVGTSDPERLAGTPGADVIAAEGGNDKVNAKGGNDLVCAGSGKDSVKGGGGKDRLFGEGGRDTLRGGAGRDRLKGGAGRDKLRGGPGVDVISGGPGKDNQKQ